MLGGSCIYRPCKGSLTDWCIDMQVSEAHAGSDVFGLQTTAVKTEDGKYWIINGHKKWITNATYVVMRSHSAYNGY